MTKTFFAFYDNKQVGKRTSKDRIYTHAVVVVDILGLGREAWCAPVRDTRENRSGFDYYRSIANGTYTYAASVDDALRTRAQFIASAGYEAYLQYLTDQNIETWKRRQAAKNLEPHVYGWSMNERNAQKMAQQATRHGKLVVSIVPVNVYPHYQDKVATAG